MSAPTLSIVIAVKESHANLAAIAERLDAPPEIEIIYVFAGMPKSDWRMPDRARLVVAEASMLIPHLWRDGIMQAGGTAVALLSAHCVPAPDWVDQLVSADLHSYVGVGGAIGLDPTCSALHRAVYLLRYLRFAPPFQARSVDDIAADNSIYRRSALLGHADLLAQGFWEPSFHRRFTRSGLRMSLDPRLRVDYRGRESGVAFARQRCEHGCEYGASRAAGRPLLRRLAFVTLSPLAPLAILGRIILRASRRIEYAASLVVALPWLAWFLCAWSLGEARGYLKALMSSDAESAVHD